MVNRTNNPLDRYNYCAHVTATGNLVTGNITGNVTNKSLGYRELFFHLFLSMTNDKVIIKNYLNDRNPVTKKGKCKLCQKEVYWSNDKLYSHKRTNCTVPQSDLHLWAAKSAVTTMLVNLGSVSSSSNIGGESSGVEDSNQSLDTPRPQKIRVMESFVDRINQDEADEIKMLISRFVYRTGIPFRTIESQAFSDLIRRLRPAFFKCGIPSAESMSFAYLMTPVGASAKWFGYDYVQAKTVLKQRIRLYYTEETNYLQCEKELADFLVQMNDSELSPCLKEEYFSIDGKSYWSQYGRKDYPLLGRVITPLFTIPTSSAAAERVWSIFTWIHSKKRNRLLMDRVEKLVYIYVNSALLDSIDKNDYFEEAESDDEETY
jgi:hypothetical protein